MFDLELALAQGLNLILGIDEFFDVPFLVSRQVFVLRSKDSDFRLKFGHVAIGIEFLPRQVLILLLENINFILELNLLVGKDYFSFSFLFQNSARFQNFHFKIDWRVRLLSQMRDGIPEGSRS